MAPEIPGEETPYTHSGGETYKEDDRVGSLTKQSAKSETSAMMPLVVGPLQGGNREAAPNLQGADAGHVVGALPSGTSPRGHGTAGTNDQAVAAGHVISETSHALTGAEYRLDETREDYVIEPGTPADETAATLSTGAGGAAGRRQEDDANLVVGIYDTQGQADDPQTDVMPPLKERSKGVVAGPGVIAFDPSVGDKKPGGRSRQVRAGDYTGALQAVKRDAVMLQTGGHGQTVSDTAGTLQAFGPGSESGAQQQVVALVENQRAEVRERDHTRAMAGQGGKGQGVPNARVGGAVRRLTPTECERLQGLPDGWTLLVTGCDLCARGEKVGWLEGDDGTIAWLHPAGENVWVPCPGTRTADGPRYAGLGDAVTATVARWLGGRILAAHRASM